MDMRNKSKKGFFTRMLRNWIALTMKHERNMQDPAKVDILINEIQRMNQIGFICLVLLFSGSCASKKEILKTDVKTEIQSSQKIDQQVNQENQEKKTDQTREESIAVINIQEIERKTSAWEYELSRFDTSLPVDSLTGTPPVKEVIKIRSKESKETDYKSGTEIKYTKDQVLNYVNFMTSSYRLEADVLKTENTRLKTELENIEIPASNWWKWLLAGVFIGCVGVILVIFYIEK